MQATDLKFPGDCTHGKTIRREVAYEISRVQIAVQQGAPVDARFAGFLADAAFKTPGYVPVVASTQYVVNHGSNVTVKNSAGNDVKVGVATVVGGVLTGVALAATEAIVTNGETIRIENATGGVVSTGAPATVAVGAVTKVMLGTQTAVVANGGKVSVGTVTGSGTFGTFTILNNVITGIVLSAS